MTTTFDSLAEYYDAGRNGYSNELYDTLIEFGLAPGSRVLDVGCGTGLAGAALIENDFRVTGVDVSEPMLAKACDHFPQATWVMGPAEALPFADRSFDATISAQAFTHFDGPKALAELIRVLVPRGIVAVWWKIPISEDPVKLIRDGVARELGFDPPQPGLGRGFKEFYAAPLTDRLLRVIPWVVTMPAGAYMQYERSRKHVHDTFGVRADEYLALVEERLSDRFGAGNSLLTLSFLQMLYLARTP